MAFFSGITYTMLHDNFIQLFTKFFSKPISKPLSFSSSQDRGHAVVVHDEFRDDHGHCDEINVPKDLSAVALQLCWTLVKPQPFDHQT